MQYEKNQILLEGRTIWILRTRNCFDDKRTLLLSKVSEALKPDTIENHIGAGGSMDDFLLNQKNVKFIINGGFNHYRKDFYDWPNSNYNIGDPVGLVKIRHHYFEDHLGLQNYGFFIQQDRNLPWQIVQHQDITGQEKYILGYTPLLIQNGKPTRLSVEEWQPVDKNKVNPPSFLGHGLQNHPRTAVGLKQDEIVFVVVEKDEIWGGCSLCELQQVGLDLQLDGLLNLDGGGSSQFRLLDSGKWITNFMETDDRSRILGNVIVLFEKDETA